MGKEQRPVSIEAYYAVQSFRDSNQLPPEAWQVYEALWHKGPLKRQALLELLHRSTETGRSPFLKQIKWLAKRGLVSEVKGVFDTTDAKTLNVPPPPAKRPSVKKFAKGVEDLEMALVRAEGIGYQSPEATAVLAWLRGKLG